MDREHFKSLRRKYIVIAGVIWLIVTIIDVQASTKTGWFGIEYSTSLMPLGWWIPFVAGHYIAKSKARSDYAAKTVERINEEKRLAQEQEAEAARVYRQSRLSRYRTTILDCLHSANNFIDLFSDPLYQEQKTMVKQKLTGELHAITVDIPLNDLTEVIRSNKDIQIKVRQLNTRLKDHSIEDANIEIMLDALKS